MPQAYVIARGDTLAKVAQLKMGDRKLAKVIADYNALGDARQVVVGQVIYLPTARELKPPRALRSVQSARAVTPWPPPPNGLAAIVKTFGNIWDYVADGDRPDPKWEAQFMVSAQMPFAMPLDWAPAQTTSKIRCHKLIAPLLQAVFAEIVAQSLQGSVKTYGGGYCWRMKRGQAKPSTHSWGIAVDLNARTNAMGTAGDMDPKLVTLFERYGFTWGGRWSGRCKDPMHFQYCSGY
ncbi:MAG TPA: M15 family metallopeptidase [Burkholderiales bacterium]|nr:M15 family metallopeptidase [Burkholderiales bacterium]